MINNTITMNRIKHILWHTYRGAFHNLPSFGPNPSLMPMIALMAIFTVAEGIAGFIFTSCTFIPIFLFNSYFRSVDDPEPLPEVNSSDGKDVGVAFTVSEIQDIADALQVAMTDINQHLQVAKYNTRGQINTGEFIDKPNPPVLIHEAGIAQSEAVIARCRKTWLKVWNKIQDE